MTASPVRLILADDHTLFREGLRQLLHGPEHSVVAESSNGVDALRLISTHAPDVALLDLDMPPEGAIGTLRGLARLGLDTPCIVVTMTATAEAARRSLDAGARGYCIKDRGIDEVRFAIRSAMSGGTFVSPVIARALSQPTSERPVLTDRERQIVALIGGGLTSKAIARELHISVRTVDAHRRNIARKLSLESASALVAYAARSKLGRP